MVKVGREHLQQQHLDGETRQVEHRPVRTTTKGSREDAATNRSRETARVVASPKERIVTGIRAKARIKAGEQLGNTPKRFLAKTKSAQLTRTV